jgi:hypothetical protein
MRMKRLMSWRVWIGVIIGLYLGWYTGGKVATAQSQTDPLVGKWAVEVTPEEDARSAGEKQFKDVLVFTKGETFIAEECRKRGFEAGKYETDQRRFGPAKFTANIESKKEGKAKWEGLATGQNIEGTLVWTKKDGSVMRYAFKGERKEEKK